MSREIRERIRLIAPLLKSGNLQVREAAAQAIETLESKTDLAGIAEALRNGSTGEKITAVIALGNIGGEKVLKALFYALSRPEEDIRIAAINAIGKTAIPSALENLTLQLDDKSSAIQSATIKALRNFAISQTLAARIRIYLDANDGILEAEAALTLASCGDIASRHGIINLLTSQHPSTCIAAAQALSRLPV